MNEFYYINPTSSFDELIQLYQSVVGRPPMIPRNSLGFHQYATNPKDTQSLRD